MSREYQTESGLVVNETAAKEYQTEAGIVVNETVAAAAADIVPLFQLINGPGSQSYGLRP